MAAQNFFQELRRRHVVRVGVAYAVTAWLLLQLGSLVFPIVHAPDWCEGVLLAFLVLGFPLALFLAWAFEITPEGVRRTEPVESEQARASNEGRRVGRGIDFVIIGVLAVAVGVLLWRQSVARHPAVTAANVQHARPAANTAPKSSSAAPAQIPPKSIAVLPFENLSGDKNNAYFADGMQDMILTKLADIGGLKVISRTSTAQYKSRPENLKIIAHQLDVANILEGSVQKARDQVLINVQLVDARTDGHLWAQSYQRTLENIFGVEGEVAEKVAVALKTRLDPAEQARVASVPTHNPAAYDAYLKGLVLESGKSETPGNLLVIARNFRQAVKFDPDFALAWARLSSVLSLAYFNFVDNAQSVLMEARQALDRAGALTPDAAATQIAEGDYAYYGHRDYARALTAYRRALQAAPNDASALAQIGYVERRLGHWQASVDDQERAVALDPRNVNFLDNLEQSYANLHRFGKAEEILRRALAISPDDQGTIRGLAGLYQEEGKLAQATKVLAGAKFPAHAWRMTLVEIQQALLTRQYDSGVRLLRRELATPGLPKLTQGVYYERLGYMQQLAGNVTESRRAYRQAVAILRQVPATPPMLYFLALSQAGLGEKDGALASAARIIAATPASRDAYDGPFFEALLAIVQTRVGEKAQAVATLKRLLSPPPGSNIDPFMSPALLRLDPVWDPLRKDPAFQALLAQAKAAG